MEWSGTFACVEQNVNFTLCLLNFVRFASVRYRRNQFGIFFSPFVLIDSSVDSQQLTLKLNEYEGGRGGGCRSKKHMGSPMPFVTNPISYATIPKYTTNLNKCHDFLRSIRLIYPSISKLTEWENMHSVCVCVWIYVQGNRTKSEPTEEKRANNIYWLGEIHDNQQASENETAFGCCCCVLLSFVHETASVK